MNLIKKIMGPRSKYDKSIPYTYMAREPVLDEADELYNHYFSDTVCGLIEYLDENRIEPETIKLFGLYRKREIELDIKYCIDDKGNWLKRPKICNSLETHYKNSLEFQYKGHAEKTPCMYEDRERDGNGPY